ncbi:MAG: efflux RND transporter periplasmic adaptor subunit [Gammaproteobacteria bacterium]
MTIIDFRTLCAFLTLSLLLGCAGEPEPAEVPGEAEAAAADYPRGPHNGRLLSDGSFALELAIFETGVPPEFHAWAAHDGEPVAPGQVDLTVTLMRLDETNRIEFAPQDDYLRSTATIFEPHSFSVVVEAGYQGMHRWTYDSFEGRTTIAPSLSSTLGIETEIAGPRELKQTVEALGRVVPDAEHSRAIHARFDGLVQEVNASLGERVEAGQALMVIESNESLKPYTVTAPIAGIVAARNVNPGEQTDGRLLMEIADPAKVRAELAIFPSDRARVVPGAMVQITPASGGDAVSGSVASFAAELGAGQSLIARVALDNPDGRFAPGTFVSATIDTGAVPVPLAVKREGLQPFRDFTVVYAKVGDQYEVRMLELGRQDAEYVEVLGGLKPGTEYVTTNSYILKADVEKSGASHDH